MVKQVEKEPEYTYHYTFENPLVRERRRKEKTQLDLDTVIEARSTIMKNNEKVRVEYPKNKVLRKKFTK
jgi:hypothetical protein